MARAEVGTTKYQSKQLKASGLQKLQFYCQLCSKQCRDANGFKNHLGSPSHVHKTNELTERGKASLVVHNYSKTFMDDFLRLLRINHGTKMINANKFYQEYILSDRDHIHMNATRWSSLTSFIKYLSEKSMVQVRNLSENQAILELNMEISLIDKGKISQQKHIQRDSDLKVEATVELRMLRRQIEMGKSKPPETQKVPKSTPLQKGPISVSLRMNKPVKPSATCIFGDKVSSDDDQDGL